MSDDFGSRFSFRSVHDDWPEEETDPGSSPYPEVEKLQLKIQIARERLLNEELTTKERNKLEDNISDMRDEVVRIMQDREATHQHEVPLKLRMEMIAARIRHARSMPKLSAKQRRELQDDEEKLDALRDEEVEILEREDSGWIIPSSGGPGRILKSLGTSFRPSTARHVVRRTIPSYPSRAKGY